MKKLAIIVFTIFMYTSCFCAKGLPIKQTELMTEKANQGTILDHSAWDKLLKKYVANNGDVDYKGFKKDAPALNNYINYLASKVPVEDWSKQEQLAYFINVYNANTIQLIIDNYPTKSIKDISSPWSKNRIKIGDEHYSLSEIENDVLRKMNEPRIHFAINCASYSCPKLLNTAYTSENVDALLEKTAKGFIADSEKNKISENKIQISKIFKWYKGDFTEKGTLIAYLNQYSKIKINTKADIDYLDYDWNLNEQN